MDIVRAARQAVERRMSISDFDAVLDMFAGGGTPSYTGKLVSPRNALSVSSCWACVNVLADDWATLPLLTYRWLKPGESREEARDHYLWPLFTEEANPRMSSHRFKKVMETWRQLWGNAYAEVEMNGRGQVIALWPWRPDRVKVWPLNPDDVRSPLMYTYFPKDRTKEPVTLSEDRILHVRHTSLDGMIGLSPIEVFRQQFGLQMAMTEHAGRFYANGATLRGVLKHPGKLGDKAYESLKESVDEKYVGLANAHRMMILEEGMDYKEIGLKMEDAQFIESMNFNVTDSARIYKVPPHRIGQLDRSTNNNIEQQAMEYVQYTLGPNAANWCGEIHCSLLSARERDSIFTEPDYTYLLTADHSARAAYYTALGNLAAVSPDDVRHLEGWNPLPNGLGKIPRAPVNTAPLGSEVASGNRSNAPEPKPPKASPGDE